MKLFALVTGALFLFSSAGATRLTVVTDTSGAPDTQAWAETAAGVVKEWYPKIVKALHAPAPKELTVTLKFDPNYKGVAATGGHTITINPDWIRKHPEDKGMVVHELTHVVQGYPRYNPVWLVEGIADYVRFFVYEPQTPIKPPTATSSYKNSYRVTARFLNWVSKHYRRHIVSVMDHALRTNTYTPELWKKQTRLDLDTLWQTYVSKESGAAPQMTPAKTQPL